MTLHVISQLSFLLLSLQERELLLPAPCPGFHTSYDLSADVVDHCLF